MYLLDCGAVQNEQLFLLCKIASFLYIVLSLSKNLSSRCEHEMPYSYPAQPMQSLNMYHIPHVARISSPTDHTLLSVKTASQLTLRLDDLALQDSKTYHVLAVLGFDPGQPNTLSCLGLGGRFCFARLNLLGDCALGLSTAVDHHVGRVLVSANVRDEVYADTAGSLVVQVSVQTERSQLTFEFAAE